MVAKPAVHMYPLDRVVGERRRILAEIDREIGFAVRLIGGDGGGDSAIWTKMYADATGSPPTKSDSLEASALGAGMSAAIGVGWFGGFVVTAPSSEEARYPT